MFNNRDGIITVESTLIPLFFQNLRRIFQVLMWAIQQLLSCVTENPEEQDNQQLGNL